MANIAELTRQLREEFRKQYGVEAHIQIGIHEHWQENGHLDGRVALQLGLAMARQYGEDTKVEVRGRDGADWVNVRPDYSENTCITLFYKKGGCRKTT